MYYLIFHHLAREDEIVLLERLQETYGNIFTNRPKKNQGAIISVIPQNMIPWDDETIRFTTVERVVEEIEEKLFSW